MVSLPIEDKSIYLVCEVIEGEKSVGISVLELKGKSETQYDVFALQAREFLGSVLNLRAIKG